MRSLCETILLSIILLGVSPVFSQATESVLKFPNSSQQFESYCGTDPIEESLDTTAPLVEVISAGTLTSRVVINDDHGVRELGVRLILVDENYQESYRDIEWKEVTPLSLSGIFSADFSNFQHVYLIALDRAGNKTLATIHGTLPAQEVKAEVSKRKYAALRARVESSKEASPDSLGETIGAEGRKYKIMPVVIDIDNERDEHDTDPILRWPAREQLVLNTITATLALINEELERAVGVPAFQPIDFEILGPQRLPYQPESTEDGSEISYEIVEETWPDGREYKALHYTKKEIEPLQKLKDIYQDEIDFDDEILYVLIADSTFNSGGILTGGFSVMSSNFMTLSYLQMASSPDWAIVAWMHELGHKLGLIHAPLDHPTNVMAYTQETELSRWQKKQVTIAGNFVEGFVPAVVGKYIKPTDNRRAFSGSGPTAEENCQEYAGLWYQSGCSHILVDYQEPDQMTTHMIGDSHGYVAYCPAERLTDDGVREFKAIRSSQDASQLRLEGWTTPICVNPARADACDCNPIYPDTQTSDAVDEDVTISEVPDDGDGPPGAGDATTTPPHSCDLPTACDPTADDCPNGEICNPGNCKCESYCRPGEPGYEHHECVTDPDCQLISPEAPFCIDCACAECSDPSSHPCTYDLDCMISHTPYSFCIDGCCGELEEV